MRSSGLRRSLSGLAAVGWAVAAPVVAQVTPPAPPPEAPLDPQSPMAPLPELGVEWPDLATEPAAPADGQAGTAGDAAAALRYTVSIEGLPGLAAARIRTRFDQASTLKANERKDANVAQIDRRAREDAVLLADVLRAEGYYDASVDTRVATAGTGVVVTLDAAPGPLYRFTGVTVNGLAAAGEKADALRSTFAIKQDDPLSADKVIAGQQALTTRLGEEGFPFAKVGQPEIVVDHDTRTATLALDVDPGNARTFGRVVVPEKSLFSAEHIETIARFEPGDAFEASRLEDLRRALIQTGLVSTVKITPVPGATPDTVDVDVALERAPPRTIAGELGYGTGEGARAEISWQHRNLIPPEGAVTFRGVVGTQEQSIGAVLRRNNFRRRDHVLNASVTASHVDRNAYDAKSFQLAGSLERQTNIIFQKKWTWSLGGELLLSDERDTIGPLATPRRRTFFIAAVPTSLTYDGSDDLLNPTRGFRLSGRLSPELSFQGGTFGYARAQIDASGYQPLNDRTVLAGRIRLGTIAGAGADQIAPSRRYYAGGGGSVRGYGYQRIGPRDANNDPVGGRSLAEFSIEGRIRFGDFGIVPFFDGGNIYRTEYPTFTGIRFGTGIGARYYTNFGPIRVDVGTPINRQKGDARIAVYVSLGQAF